MNKTMYAVIILFISSTVHAQVIPYTDCVDCWNADSLGNHRAIVQFNGTGNIAKVIIPWRRRDNDPQLKRIIVQEAQSGKKVDNVKAVNINNESGEIYFEPTSGKGDYAVYYMPYKNEGRSNYPKGVYLKPESTAAYRWLQSIPQNLSQNAFVKEFQSINAFNSFYPMEVIATEKETAQLLSKNQNRKFIVFPEDRMYPIKMKDRLPYGWMNKELSSFRGQTNKGEYFAYQLGVYALDDLENVTVSFSDLKTNKGNVIAAKNSSCINNGGVDYTGKVFTKNVSVSANTVQAMWCGINVPQNAKAGIYTGKAIVSAKGLPAATININITVSDKLSKDGGTSEPWKQTRLKWLNSTLAQNNTVIAPYTALKVKNNTISLLGRKIELNRDGFPKQIQTFFSQELTGYQTKPNNILSAPFHFIVSTADVKNVAWKSSGLQFTKKERGTVQWKTINTSNALQMEVAASLEFDGFVSYTVKITALSDVQIKDIALKIPFSKEASKYMIGLGQKGGNRPQNFNWKWEVATKNQDGTWIGNVAAGLQYSLRDEKYVRPLNTNFYLQKPLLLPSSWGNENKGGITISDENNSVLANNYSGERTMRKGNILYYNFTLLITPFHPINTDFQWSTRFYHRYNDLDSIKASGATVINIHHATPINPWINYPFIEWKKMKAYVDEAHSKKLKVKIYNTVRELSNHAYETFAMRSLGHEIYSPGKGGGFSWLQEHLDSDYIAAWFVPEIKDAAIVNSGMSRWHNYYVEGMNWLTQNVGIDGIYLDDVAFDRVTMKRIKRVLTKNGHPGIIDLHSANQYNKNDGFNNSANLYMEHFPYLNRLWFGEYFDYEKNSPDFFLTEVSGIPFGLMGEMLEGGGNPWRGMIYGMTNRFPWTEEADPRPIWKFWDSFGIMGTKMIGYWSENCPVKTNNDKVLATVYKKGGAALISIASWADNNVDVKLRIDWKSLGIDSAKATIIAKEIKNFQQAKTFAPNQSI
ncbi:MAG: DUF6067 family protein, partial [Bacteroidota bacterium]|nr:DUF6067 family protein [Bacteroidota bacterium]